MVSSFQYSVEALGSVREIIQALTKCEEQEGILKFWQGAQALAAQGCLEQALLRQQGLLKLLHLHLRKCANTRPPPLDLTNLLLECLPLLAACVDGSREFSAYGGHKTLMALLDDDDTMEAVDMVLASDFGQACSSAGCPFPCFCQAILEEEEIVKSPLVEYDFLEYTTTKEIDATKSWRVYIRSIPELQESQFTVGYIMWSAAVIMARWAHRFSHLFVDKEIHEVGAGLGLTGLAMSNIRNCVVTLSDFNPRVVENLHFNAALNQSSCGRVHVMEFDWSILECLEGTGAGSGISLSDSVHLDPVDLVIGSDVICQRSDARLLVNVIKHLLKPDGIGIFCLPSSENRFGTEAFREFALDSGFCVQTTPIEDDSFTEGLEEASYFKWNLHVVSRQGKSSEYGASNSVYEAAASCQGQEGARVDRVSSGC